MPSFSLKPVFRTSEVLKNTFPNFGKVGDGRFWGKGLGGGRLISLFATVRSLGLVLCLVGSCVEATDVMPLVERAEVAYGQGRWIEARETLFRASGLADNPEQKQLVLERLGALNMALLLSPYEQPESIWLEVQPGDTLGKIAARANTTIELLKTMNRMNSNTVRLGRRIKVLYATFTVEVDKSENLAVLKLDGRFFKQYQVSTGANANTPVGVYHITDRILHPDWWHPETKQRIPYGAEGHKIGTHWLGWDVKGFGIHGTDEPEKLGQAVSLGCVRMRNEEVGELYMLLPAGTTIDVKE